jgi:hypothetical protein
MEIARWILNGNGVSKNCPRAFFAYFQGNMKICEKRKFGGEAGIFAAGMPRHEGDVFAVFHI